MRAKENKIRHVQTAKSFFISLPRYELRKTRRLFNCWSPRTPYDQSDYLVLGTLDYNPSPRPRAIAATKSEGFQGRTAEFTVGPWWYGSEMLAHNRAPTYEELKRGPPTV